MNLTPTAHWLEWVDWSTPILQDTGFRVDNGKYYIPDIPGTGIEWNETKNHAKILIIWIIVRFIVYLLTFESCVGSFI